MQTGILRAQALRAQVHSWSDFSVQLLGESATILLDVILHDLLTVLLLACRASCD